MARSPLGAAREQLAAGLDPEFLDVPPEEAIRHFRAKNPHTGFDWRDIDAASPPAQLHGGRQGMSIDILDDILGAIDEALVPGPHFRQFQQRLEPVLRQKGWRGRQGTTDPRWPGVSAAV